MSRESISDNPTNVNPNPTPHENETSQLSKPNKSAYEYLDYKYLYWKSRKDLGRDGSFFITNQDFAEGTHVLPRAIRRTKKRLRARGLIRYTTTPGRYGKTYYWLTEYDRKPVKATPPPVKERPPLDPEAVLEMEKLKGMDYVLTCVAFQDYSKTEIEGCF